MPHFPMFVITLPHKPYEIDQNMLFFFCIGWSQFSLDYFFKSSLSLSLPLLLFYFSSNILFIAALKGGDHNIDTTGSTFKLIFVHKYSKLAKICCSCFVFDGRNFVTVSSPPCLFLFFHFVLSIVFHCPFHCIQRGDQTDKQLDLKLR